MNEILVSVLVLAYNHELYIAKALEGILMQEVSFPIEVVIGEDKSQDKTLAICQEYQRRFPDKIKILKRDANIGMMNNYMDTLLNCAGKYVAICEGDDYWIDPKKLQKQVAILEENKQYSSVCSGVIEKNNDEEIKSGHINNEIDFDTLCNGNPIHTCTVTFRRELLQLPLWIKKYKMGDWITLMLLAEKAPIYYMNQYTAVYRVHAGGIWSKDSKESNLLKMLYTYNDLFVDFHKHKSLLKDGKKNFYKILLNSYIQNGSLKFFPMLIDFKKEYLTELVSVYLFHFFYRLTLNKIRILFNIISNKR